MKTIFNIFYVIDKINNFNQNSPSKSISQTKYVFKIKHSVKIRKVPEDISFS